MPNPTELLARKQYLIEQIIQHPLDFTDEQFLELVKIGQDDDVHKKEVELNLDDLLKKSSTHLLLIKSKDILKNLKII